MRYLKYKFIIILFSLIITGYLYNLFIIKNKVEGYENLNKTTYLNLEDPRKGYISLESVIPKYEYSLGIEKNPMSYNFIDRKIASYMKNNIYPYTYLYENNNINNIKLVNNNELDLAIVREYSLIDHNLYFIDSSNNDNIRLLMPIYEKYFVIFSNKDANIQFLSDINENNNFIDSKFINIYYFNDEDYNFINSILNLIDLTNEIENKIKLIKFDFKDIKIKDSDLIMGFISPKDINGYIEKNKLSPVIIEPKNSYKSFNQRVSADIFINKEDQNEINKFHYDLKQIYKWLFKAEIYLDINTQLYRTYRIRYLLITNKNNKLKNKNLKTIINNWYMHRNILMNINLILKNNNEIEKTKNIPEEKFKELAFIPSNLKFHKIMKEFLINNGLIKVK